MDVNDCLAERAIHLSHYACRIDTHLCNLANGVTIAICRLTFHFKIYVRARLGYFKITYGHNYKYVGQYYKV